MKSIGVSLIGFLFIIVSACGVYLLGYRASDRICQAAWSERDTSEAIAILNNFSWTLDIFRQAQEVNRHDKNQIALDTQRTTFDIKNYTEDADSADRVVPDVYNQRLREYAESLRDRPPYPYP